MNLPDVNAAVGLAQLSRLDSFNRRRRELAEHYFRHLPASELLVLPAAAAGHSWHMFCVCIDHVALGKTRAEMLSLFSERGIAVGTHYPAMHLFSLYRRFGYSEGDFPVAEKIGEQTLTLPLFPAMTEADVEHVCATVAAVVSGQI